MSVAFVREESAEAAQEVTLPERPISTHPNLVTPSGLKGLEQALVDSQEALKAAQLFEEPNERRRAVALAARDARYFSERLASAHDYDRRQTYRIVGEDEADPRLGTISYFSPLARRLIGKRVGDLVGMDGREIEILAIA